MLKFLPGIPLFLGVFTRRRGIRGGYGVWLEFLTRISMCWAVSPWGDCAIRGVCYVWGEVGVWFTFSRDPLVLGWPLGPYLEGLISPFLFCSWGRQAGGGLE